MNVEALLGEVIRGALGARGKRHHGALHILSGRHGSLLTPAMLVGALGVAWGLYETATSTSAGASPQGATAASPPPVPPRQGASVANPPPVPSPQDAPAASPPPIPVPPVPRHAAVESSVTGHPADTSVLPADVARVVRLTVSAARADGTLTETEQSSILSHAQRAGAESIVREELATPTPLAAIVSGVPDSSRADLYRLAFTIVRADEAVSGAERIYLAQLAHALGLSPDAAGALEAEAAQAIEGAKDQPPAA